MTVTEFKNEFNIAYDGVSSNQAPALDDYEISVFLTRAQEELVKNKFERYSNRLERGFEESSKRRNDLENLIKQYTSTSKANITDNIETGTSFFIIPSDIFLIVQESAKIVDDECNDQEVQVSVKPVTHDEYNTQKNNPFKRPDKTIVWRLDYNNSSGNNVIEIVSDKVVNSYQVRYIKRPLPIIVSDLTSFGEGLTINSYSAARTSELNDTVHREIVDRAVGLAIAAYRENNLGNMLSLSNRNE